ncbi:YdcF family protein [Psychrobacillus sp.]|uniref:YdcF family protein n=1 Tax=Psychrobacillus sp. TaxID=1871623 RepID=UPI0028BEFC10|nr:YdcF family protein [Psychrobacillus sp.]
MELFALLLLSSVSIMYLYSSFLIIKSAKTTADGEFEYVIILGAKILAGGIPTYSLKNRLDVAIPYLTKYQHIKVIVSGGQGSDEDQPEALAMQNYLLNAGIEPSRIILEDKAITTYESFQFSKGLLPNNIHEITIISNDYHLRRSKYLAKLNGFESDAIAAKTPNSVKLKSWLREGIALIKSYLLKN